MAPLAQLKPDDLRLAETKPSLIAVSPVVSIQSALNLMKANKITSLPVFSHDSTQIVSIINLFDILLYLVGGSDTVNKDTFKLDDPVEYVLDLDSDRESYWMHKTDSQDDLHATLRAFASGVHRSLVVDYSPQKKGPWLLSQTDIIRHIRAHPESVAPLDIRTTVGSLGFDKKPPLVSVLASQSALNGYRLLAQKNLGGVPIVDEQGDLLGDLCLEDLPGADLEVAEKLTLPCLEYTTCRPTGGQLPTATPDTLLVDVLDIMLNEDTHRVWITKDNASKKVIGVVTMSDIIGLLL
ncbi:hypothetical protein BCR43DRAFT_484626 [Syncephalastrum racemosum]|uniref:CBS domain-containing protein n=1 Tax=Syncephalastrum racemosum TaxID=13706 RepID=A0A1X2HL10_SYNRA|nr:hypothetical protein BCR43DRAFT_484626 [Syncephalastrum racemosum]